MDKIDELVEQLTKYNEAYRRGKPLVSDREYDGLVEDLQQLDPDHPFLHAVEPETFDAKVEIKHPVPMLSTEKAYTREALERFINRVEKEASNIGIGEVFFKVTAKLDGLAGRDDGNVFASRGNGEVGYEISSAFKKGVVPFGGRGLGLGEIVMVKSYFDTHLSDKFEHPRNMVVGIISSDTLNEHAQEALENGKVVFVPYVMLPSWTGKGANLLNEIEVITEELLGQSDYPMDGLVAEVVDPDIKDHMGATAHHYRWQIAIKSKGETTTSVVEDIHWQVGRTGNITPVLQIRPVSLSGATIRRVTAHHAGMVEKEKIGPGSEIKIIRSGEVIPKLEKVIRTSTKPHIPETCPECGEVLQWNNDFLKCVNFDCRAQTAQRISHWFKTLGNADWFGIKTIRKLVENGYDSLEKIYAMGAETFQELGFGPVQSRNLAEAIQTSIRKAVEDWRFLAAFGISDLGKGDSRKLLTHIRLEAIPDVRADQILRIHGFGEKTSQSIVKGIKQIKKTMSHMMGLGFNLEMTPLPGEMEEKQSRVNGKALVFTGKMQQGTREEMQAQARKLGARVQTSVTGKTDFLVCGRNVGRSKIEKAEKTGTRVISEKEYLEMINH